MSTTVIGEVAAVFSALQNAFAQAAGHGHVAMTVAVSKWSHPAERDVDRFRNLPVRRAKSI
jgi:hypothetical protein